MTRWQPTRAGILNVWRYYDEVFTFCRGRLLLRGPNGSGKSKALELLLPFLLDASLQPSRLSTFGQGSRSMHWNLMGQGASGSTRVGYVWLELGRDNDELDGEHVTIGARLAASRSETRPRVDYFLARGRVGVNFELTADGAPLTAVALRDELGEFGTVFPTAGEYRTAVRQTVFPTMTPERYDTLVHALLQLRRPKLSEHLDPEALSSILSAALPPVDDSRIEELAEGFERLDQQRDHLQAMDDEVRAAQALLDATRAYAAVTLRERAKAVTGAATEFDRTSRDLRRGADQLVEARQAEIAATEAAEEASRHLATLAADSETLRRSDDYREGRNLEELRRGVGQARSAAARATADAERAGVVAQESARRAKQRDDEGSAALRRVDALRADAVDRARAIDLAHLVDHPADLQAQLAVRTAQADELTGLLDVHDRALDERARRDGLLSAASDALAAARDGAQDAEARLAVAAAAHADDVTVWARSCTELDLPTADVLAALERDQLESLVGAVLGDRLADLSAQGALLERELQETRAHLADLTGQRAELVAARVVEPPVSRFRSSDRVDGGAPLWRVVDFRDEVTDDVRAALEAALEASGLLDAWVTADGLVRVEGHDVVLEPAASRGDTAHLGAILRPDGDAPGGPTTDVVARVLAAIGHAATAADEPGAHSWVASDGRWRLGVAHGSWSKPAAQYIGAGARERHRLAQIADLDVQIAEENSRELRAQDQLDIVAVAVEASQREAERRPTDTDVRAARAAADRATMVVAERDRLVAEARRERDEAAASVARAADAVSIAADRLRLPSVRTELARVRRCFAELREQVATLVMAQGVADSTAASATSERERAAADERHQVELVRRATDDVAAADALGARLEALQEHLGGSYERAVQRLEELQREITAAERAVPAARRAQSEAAKAVATLEERSVGAERAHETAVARRDAAHEELVAALRTTLARDADVTVDLTDDDRVRAVLETARQLDRQLPQRANDTVVLAHNRLTQRFYDNAGRLASRAQLELADEAGMTVPVAAAGGRRLGMRELLVTVQDERSRAADEITESEHKLFEQALTGDTRRHLSTTIRDARELVDRMNARLATVRTASNVQVRLRWELRDEEGASLREAQSLLLKNPARLSDEEQGALYAFFRARIDQAHTEQPGTTWVQQLAAVFDYTAWHRFRVEMTRGDDQGWKPLTRQAHGVLSGGEKAIALHLPLFAALAAHYEATPEAPRLILLDEVFVGIDAVNRGQIFALLRDLDLDLVLTSDHEWATYPEVDGIAVHALAVGADDDAVTTTRFVWTGHELIEEPDEGLLFA